MHETRTGRDALITLAEDGKDVTISKVANFSMDDSCSSEQEPDPYANHPYVRGTHGAERQIRIRTLKRLRGEDK